MRSRIRINNKKK